MTAFQRISDATEFIRGITFKPDELISPEDEGAVVCMRTKNIQNELDESDLIAVPKRLVRSPEKYLRPGDILISSANSWELVGKCSYVGELGYLATAGGFISIVRPKPMTHARFLYHWLTNPSTQHVIRNLGRQTTNISNLDVNRFKQLEFPEIDFDKQSDIAAILDKADGIRRMREQAVKLADELIKSTFFEMFGDPVKNERQWPSGVIGDCLRGVVGGWSANSDSRPATQSEFGVLKISAVTSGEYIPSENKVVTSVPGDKKLIVPQTGDLLFSRANTRELVAATCVVMNAQQNVFLPDKLWRLDVDQSVAEASYLKCVLSHPEYRQLLCARATGTSGSMLNISKAKLVAHPIPIPPIELQRAFATLWKRIKMLSAKRQVEAAEANSLFRSLSNSAFLGDL